MEPACSPRVAKWVSSAAQIKSTARNRLGERRFRQLQTSKTFRNRERSRGVPDAPSTASGRNPEDGDANDGHQANEGSDSSRMRRVECLERTQAGGIPARVARSGFERTGATKSVTKS